MSCPPSKTWRASIFKDLKSNMADPLKEPQWLQSGVASCVCFHVFIGIVLDVIHASCLMIFNVLWAWMKKNDYIWLYNCSIVSYFSGLFHDYMSRNVLEVRFSKPILDNSSNVHFLKHIHKTFNILKLYDLKHILPITPYSIFTNAWTKWTYLTFLLGSNRDEVSNRCWQVQVEIGVV